MIHFQKSRAALAAVLILTGMTALAADKETNKAELNEKAPAFKLTDLANKSHALADYKGKIVVLEWFNPDCPFCVGVYKNGVVEDTLKALKKIDKDIVYLAVNSSAHREESDIRTSSKKHLKKFEQENIPVLVDYNGAVGRSFGARTTPHMFVIDKKGILRYEGAFTDDPRGKKNDAMNYVINAVKQLEAHETVSPDRVKPWGCSVKYQKKN